MFASVAATADSLTFVDTRSWFCAFDRCPAFVGSTPVCADGTHLTDAYSRALGRLLAESSPLDGP